MSKALYISDGLRMAFEWIRVSGARTARRNGAVSIPLQSVVTMSEQVQRLRLLRSSDIYLNQFDFWRVGRAWLTL